jgi:hypothetical protein
MILEASTGDLVAVPPKLAAASAVTPVGDSGAVKPSLVGLYEAQEL